MCVMKTATIRDAQHHFSALLRLVQRGEEVEILSRKTPVARIVPAKSIIGTPGKIDWSDHAPRLKKLWKGKMTTGDTTDVILNELRGER